MWDHNSPSCKAGCLVGHCASAFPLEGNDRPAVDTALKPFFCENSHLFTGSADISVRAGLSAQPLPPVLKAAFRAGRAAASRHLSGIAVVTNFVVERTAREKFV